MNCRVFAIIFALLLPYLAPAQLTITPTGLASVLANKLAGPGVVIISPSLTCPVDASAIFTGTSSLSFGEGILLSTGQARSTPGTFGADGLGSDFASTGFFAPGDVQLSALAGQATFDACFLEFDFKPQGDTIKFRYVFGSEEYTDFTCSSFNDVFGFYISGPGYSTPKNIAIVPGTNIPVCINSVNCGATGGWLIDTCQILGPGAPFCAYYVDNTGGTTITYDGLTTTLIATAKVTPCDTYHLKIGIADAGDDILDSGVFLEKGSFTSSSEAGITALGINNADTAYGSQYSVRGCFPGKFIFKRSGSADMPLTLHYVIAGTAVNGYDYSTIADSITIAAGKAVDTLMINALTVAPAGPKTVKLLLLSSFPCNGSFVITDSAILTIYDSLFVRINTPDTAICPGNAVLINTSGDPRLLYSWAPSATLDSDTILSPLATPSVTTSYTVTAVYPGSGCAPSTDNITIAVSFPEVNIVTSDTTICADMPLFIRVNVLPADSPFTATWLSPAAGLSDSLILEPVFAASVQGVYTYRLMLRNVAGCTSTDSITIRTMPDLGLTVIPLVAEIKYGDHIQLRAMSTVDSVWYYSWTPNDGSLNDNNINNPEASPLKTTQYIVYGRNAWCMDSATATIVVDTTVNEFVSSAFSPNGDGNNDIFRIVSGKYQDLVSFIIYNRWGQKVYENMSDITKGWDGTLNGAPQDVGVYFYQCTIARPSGKNVTYVGDVTLIR